MLQELWWQPPASRRGIHSYAGLPATGHGLSLGKVLLNCQYLRAGTDRRWSFQDQRL